MFAPALHGETGRLYWLVTALSEQRRRVKNLFARSGDLGAVEGMKPTILRKFFHMMEQIAVAKDHEILLIGQIESIEQRHKFYRKKGWLKKMKAEQAHKAEEELKKRWALEEEQEDDRDEAHEDRAWIRSLEGFPETDDASYSFDYEPMFAAAAAAEQNKEKHSRWLWLLAFLSLSA